ncbi:MAG: hypothetical protein MSS85_07565 [Pyramidobacter sp.]|uniref:hypothetical protein n=1 Tax=Pyramidobacter sp. TaxID=1943581 RepID=UPI0025D8F6A2|nr:hypothetical protein [Pyramidobacter sp.]MCI7403927.1 hypothetical protein [Pyramidobacter sp.]
MNATILSMTIVLNLTAIVIAAVVGFVAGAEAYHLILGGILKKCLAMENERRKDKNEQTKDC